MYGGVLLTPPLSCLNLNPLTLSTTIGTLSYMKPFFISPLNINCHLALLAYHMMLQLQSAAPPCVLVLLLLLLWVVNIDILFLLFSLSAM